VPATHSRSRHERQHPRRGETQRRVASRLVRLAEGEKRRSRLRDRGSRRPDEEARPGWSAPQSSGVGIRTLDAGISYERDVARLSSLGFEDRRGFRRNACPLASPPVPSDQPRSWRRFWRRSGDGAQRGPIPLARGRVLCGRPERVALIDGGVQVHVTASVAWATSGGHRSVVDLSTSARGPRRASEGQLPRAADEPAYGLDREGLCSRQDVRLADRRFGPIVRANR
jgi:hypothetical protein